MNDCMKAILNANQIEAFCKKFDISPDELTPNFNGFYKHVLISKNSVFLFARHEDASKRLSKELDIYEQFSAVLKESVALPHLLTRVLDKNIHFYEFGEVSKIVGEPFSKYQQHLHDEELSTFLSHLATLTANWHSVDVSPLEKHLDRMMNSNGEKITLNSFERALINRHTFERAIDFWFAHVSSYMSLPDSYKNSIKAILKGVISLEEVLIHGDVHEDQVLVEKKGNNLIIKGVLDWESAFIGNPVLDFNFAEWGMEIWEKLEIFQQLRFNMWSSYLKERDLLEKVHPDSLHLFYLIGEIISSIKQKDREKVGFTGKSFSDTIEIYSKLLTSILD